MIAADMLAMLAVLDNVEDSSQHNVNAEPLHSQLADLLIIAPTMIRDIRVQEGE